MDDHIKQSAQAAALRDFFIAENAAGLESAYLKMQEVSGTGLPGVKSRQELEYAFNRLFVGPKALEAPPFASVYLENEPMVMGPTTMMVRSIYEMFGLASSYKNNLPDDHLSFELDAALAMRMASRQAASPELARLRSFFVGRHMKTWVPAFAERASLAESAHPAITAAAKFACRWVEREAASIGDAHESFSEEGGHNE